MNQTGYPNSGHFPDHKQSQVANFDIFEQYRPKYKDSVLPLL